MSRVRAWVDALLGRVTSTVLVLIALALIALYGILIDALAPRPVFGLLDAVVSLVIVLAATIFGTYLAATIARTRAKLDSTIVTALILFLLFTPSLDPAELTGLSIAGFARTLSDFLTSGLVESLVDSFSSGRQGPTWCSSN